MKSVRSLIGVLLVTLFLYPLGALSEIITDRQTWEKTNLLISDSYCTSNGSFVVSGYRNEQDVSIANGLVRSVTESSFVWDDDKTIPTSVVECYSESGELRWSWKDEAEMPNVMTVLGEFPDCRILVKAIAVDQWWELGEKHKRFFLIDEKGKGIPLPLEYQILEQEAFFLTDDGIMIQRKGQTGSFTYYTHKQDSLTEAWSVSYTALDGLWANQMIGVTGGFIFSGLDIREENGYQGAVFMLGKNGELKWKYTTGTKLSMIYDAALLENQVLCGGVETSFLPDGSVKQRAALFGLDVFSGERTSEYAECASGVTLINEIEVVDDGKEVILYGQSRDEMRKTLLITDRLLNTMEEISFNPEGYFVEQPRILRQNDQDYSILYSVYYYESKQNDVEQIQIERIAF